MSYWKSSSQEGDDSFFLKRFTVCKGLSLTMEPSTSSSRDEPINDFGQFLEASELSAASPKRLRSREVYSDGHWGTEGKRKSYTGETVISTMAVLFVTKDVTLENLMPKLNSTFNRREKTAPLDLRTSVTKELKMCIKRMIEAKLNEGANNINHAIFIWFENRFFSLKDNFIAQISSLITIYTSINGTLSSRKGNVLSAEHAEVLILWSLNVILSPLWPLSDAYYCHTLKALFEKITDIIPVELRYMFNLMSKLTMCYNWDLTALRYMKDNVFVLPKEMESFLKSEDFRVLMARIRILCNHGFFDYALTLCSTIVSRLNSCDEYRKSMPPQVALSFRDIFYILLAKQGNYEKFTIDILRNMQISSGLNFIKRLVNHSVKDLPVSLISSLKLISSYCSRAFFLTALFSPPEITGNKVMEGLILEWFNNAVTDVREGITYFVLKCRYSQHIYSLCNVLEENVHSLKRSELVAVYLEGLKRDCADSGQLKVDVSLRARIGNVLYKLSGWFVNNQNLYREMILCCFSVYPTQMLKSKIGDMWKLRPNTTGDEKFCLCPGNRQSNELCENCGRFGRTIPLKPFRAKYFEEDIREALIAADIDLGPKDSSTLAKVLFKLRLVSDLSWETKPSHLSSLVGWHLTNFHSDFVVPSCPQD